MHTTMASRVASLGPPLEAQRQMLWITSRLGKCLEPRLKSSQAKKKKGHHCNLRDARLEAPVYNCKTSFDHIGSKTVGMLPNR